MKKVRVVDLFGIDYSKMNDKINEAMIEVQEAGGEITDVRVLGSALNKCAVFIVYDE